MRTPARAALRPDSPLQASIKNGLAAVRKAHAALIDGDVRGAFADSLDLDAALRAEHPQDHRWDYLLGHEPGRTVIGLEPHSARQDEVATVIAKRRAAREQLRKHLRPGVSVAAWLWVASGRVDMADTERARRLLDQNGVTFVGARVRATHLPQSPRRQGPSGRRRG